MKKKKECRHYYKVIAKCVYCGEEFEMNKRVDAVGKYDSCCIANDYLEVAKENNRD